jgi:hypothetical protein
MNWCAVDHRQMALQTGSPEFEFDFDDVALEG